MSTNEPQRPASSRIGALATLPLFFKLEGRRVLVAGGGEPALWKCELIAAAGAEVNAIAETFCAAFAERPRKGIRLTARSWTPQDLEGVALAIGGMTDDEEAERFFTAARALGVPCNVIDRPRYCDFQFGAIANRSPLIIAVSTNGAAPVLGQAIRSEIEAALPEEIGSWVEAAAGWRRVLADAEAGFSERRLFWTRFAKLAREEGGRSPEPGDFERLRSAKEGPREIAIIPLGDGSAEHLTLAAVRTLKIADVVVCDRSVPLAVLDFARREALRVPLSETGYSQMARLAREGRRVVAIVEPKDGDKAREALVKEGAAALLVPVAAVATV